MGVCVSSVGVCLGLWGTMCVCYSFFESVLCVCVCGVCVVFCVEL